MGLIEPTRARRPDSRAYRMGGRRRGLTSVEILVTCGVISLLAALLLPAVQSSRESARRAGCLNNLRQLGLACQQHEAAQGAFPYTATRMRRRPDPRRLSSISPHAHLLPYLDEIALYQAVEFEHFAVDALGTLPRSFRLGPNDSRSTTPANMEALTTSVSVFLCPADQQIAGGNNYRACLGSGPGVFGRKSAATTCIDEGNETGAFIAGGRTKPREFTDGLSHTILFSEAIIGDGDPARYTPWADLFYYDGDFCTADEARNICRQYARYDAAHDSYTGTTWLFGSGRHTWYNHVVGPNAIVPDCTAGGASSNGGGRGVYAARSYHPGGVNVVFADGSARFVGESIELHLWQALATRAGKEVVASF